MKKLEFDIRNIKGGKISKWNRNGPFRDGTGRIWIKQLTLCGLKIIYLNFIPFNLVDENFIFISKIWKITCTFQQKIQLIFFTVLWFKNFCTQLCMACCAIVIVKRYILLIYCTRYIKLLGELAENHFFVDIWRIVVICYYL